MHTKTQLLALLDAHGLRLSKRLGQHYLVDGAMARRLVEDGALGPQDVVVEIGAGLGALTDLIAARAAAVHAVEVDEKICAVLKQRASGLANVEVHCADFLEFPWMRYAPVKVLGAIPYQATSPILVNLCEHAAALHGAWLAMQHEVAVRLAASPGTKAYGRLTVLVRYRFDVALLRRIPRTVFFPAPGVDSAWVRLAPRPAPAVQPRDEALFFDVVRAAFAQRRKTLANCLGLLARPRVPRERVPELLARCRLPERVRGESLSMDEFARLADEIAQMTRGD